MTGMDYGYVAPWMNFLVLCLLLIALLLVGLAWHNLRGIRIDLQKFLDMERDWRTAAALERERLADVLSVKRDKEYKEFLLHSHDEKGRIVLP